MTIDKLQMLVYYINTAKIQNYQRVTINNLIIRSILDDADLDMDTILGMGNIDMNVAEYITKNPIYEKTPANDLYQSYVKWCEENSKYTVSSTKFGKDIKSLGYSFKRTNGCIYYYGK